MKTIDLVEERLEAFRSIAEPLTIPFPRRGVYAIRGRNEDTGGSSGSGKTSVGAGISYALGFCSFPATELQSWLTDKPMRVVQALDVGGEPLIVTRGIAGLQVSGPDGKPQKGKAAEALLTQRLGLSPAMLKALTYREQRSDGTFLSKTNVEMQEFLTAVLALEPFERAYDTSQVQVKALEQRLQQMEGKLQVLTAQLLEAQADLKGVEEAFILIDVSQAEADLLLQQQAEVEWKNTRTGVYQQRDAYTRSHHEHLEEALAEVRAEQAACVQTLAKLRASAANIPRVERELAAGPGKARSLLAQLEASKTACPTCLRPWEMEQSLAAQKSFESQLQDLDAQQIELQTQLLGLRTALEQVEEYQELERCIKDTIQSITWNEQQRVEKNVLALAQACDDVDAEYQRAQQETRATLRVIADAKAVNANRQQGLEFRRKRVQATETSLGKEIDALQKCQADLFVEQDFSALIGREGFLGAIFDEVLAEVAEETNAILAQVPNVAHVTLAFRSESITGKGTTKRAITPVVSVGGHEAPLKSGCSGGMQASVYLATDLAIIDVVSRRLGVSPGWLVLDESFEGLGPVEKEGYLEVLSQYAQRKLVLIVDHGTETKEALPGIDLVMKDGRTRIDA